TTVPPPVRADLVDEGLANLRFISRDLGGRRDLAQAAAAVESASPGEIEKARLQIAFALEQIRKATEDLALQHSIQERGLLARGIDFESAFETYIRFLQQDERKAFADAS